MIQENLQINIGANTQDLQQGLNQATGAVNEFSAALNRAGKPTADATQSLVNLSRIAQDAPYGFLGISNNLNPMLESFQRLQKESGSSSEALKAMVAGLTGPAGLGVALGVVSSLLVVYGKDIASFFSNLTSGKSAMDEYISSVVDSEKAYIKAYEEIYKLGKSFEDFHNGLMSKKELLQQYNSTLGDTYGKTNDVAEAEKIWASNSENFVKGAVLRAAALIEIEKAAKKSAEAFEASLKPKEQFTSALSFGGAGVGGASAINLQAQLDKQRAQAQEEAIKKIKDEEKAHLDVVDAINKEIEKLKQKAVYTQFAGKELPKEKESRTKDYTLDDEIAKLEREIELTKKWADEEEKLHDKMQKWGNKNAKIITLDINKGEETPNKLDKEIPLFARQHTQEVNDLDKQMKQARKDAEDFANTMSKDVTQGLFTMYDAMQKGENPLKALGDYLGKLIEQLAEAVVQALLFETIMSALGSPEAATGVGGSLLHGIGKIFGFAEGGVVSQPTLAMVGEGSQSEAIMPLSKLGNMMNSTFAAGAMSGNGMGSGNGQFVLKGNDLVLALQRSNYSLNLRRGS
jgi:hypothetical protein